MVSPVPVRPNGPDDDFAYAEQTMVWLRQGFHPLVAAILAHEDRAKLAHQAEGARNRRSTRHAAERAAQEEWNARVRAASARRRSRLIRAADGMEEPRHTNRL